MSIVVRRLHVAAGLSFAMVTLLLSGCVDAPSQTPTTGAAISPPRASPQVSQVPPKSTGTAARTTPTAQPMISPTSVAQTLCPDIVGISPQEPIWSGTLIIGHPGEADRFTIWLWASGDLAPSFAYELPSGRKPLVNPTVSPEGDRLAWVYRGEEQSVLAMYDLRSNQAAELTLPGTWSRIWDWPKTDQLVLESPNDVAPTGDDVVKLLRVDLDTGESTPMAVKAPSYLYFPADRWQAFNAFLSLDPAGTLALYTALGENGTDIVLYSLQSDQAIWRKSLPGVLFIPEPHWTPDGERVVLAFWGKRTGEDYRLFALSREGQLQALMQQAAATEEFPAVRFLKWSPDSQYLYYRLGTGRPSIDGPGYVLDTKTSQYRVACDEPGREFLGGAWVGKAPLFAYADRKDLADGRYWLLDVVNWQKTLLMESSERLSASFVAWTPLTLSGAK